VNGRARLLAGIAGWTGVGILLGVLWMRTVGGVPPVWAALLFGLTVFAAVAFARSRLFAFWRSQPKGHPGPHRRA
jgi:hypothetical protein